MKQTETERVTEYLRDQGYRVTKSLVLDILILMSEAEIKGLKKGQQIAMEALSERK